MVLQVVVIDHGGYYSLDDDTRKLYAEVWSMMDEPKDEKQKAARRARLKDPTRHSGLDVCNIGSGWF